MPDNSKRPDRLPEIKAFVVEHGYKSLTGSDAFWLIEEVERLRAQLIEAHHPTPQAGEQEQP